MFKPLVQFKQVFLHFNPCVFTGACLEHKCGFNSQQCAHNTRMHTSPFGNRPEKTSELLRAHNGAVSSWMPKWPDCLAGFQIVGVCVSVCLCICVCVCFTVCCEHVYAALLRSFLHVWATLNVSACECVLCPHLSLPVKFPSNWRVAALP